jgi:hypothetical protein
MARMIMNRMIVARVIVARVIVARVTEFVHPRITSRVTVVSVAHRVRRTALVRQKESCRNHKSKASG